MGRPIGTMNVMRSPEEKERIVLEYLNGKVGYRQVARSNNIMPGLFQRWIHSYQEKGLEGLKSKTGKKKGFRKGRPKKATSEIEKLKEELLKKEIDIERLKKSYLVKGVGDQKEYVTTFDANMK